MKKTIFEQMGGTYTKVGDYYLPNLLLAEQEEQPIGVWGQRHLRYIKQHHKVRYTNLADVDKQSEDMLFRLVKQMAEREGITEQLKADNQMEWVTQMNSIRQRATEIVNTEIVYI